MPYQDRHGNICGFLDMEEKEGSGHFVRRYFLLDPGRRVFDYYMDNPQNLPPDTQAVGSFRIDYVSMVNDASKSRPKFPFCFYLMLAGQKYHFCADDNADKEAWIKALHDSARVSVPNAKSYSEGSMDSLDSSYSYKAEVVGDMVLKLPLESSLGRNAALHDDGLDNVDTSPRQLFCHQQAIKTGYCIKQGGRRKNWLRRYFVLGHDGLSYYKSPEDKSPIKSILKAEIIVARDSIGIHLNRENVFEVVTPVRVFYVQAESSAEKTSWICEINRVLAASKKPKRQEIEEMNRGFISSHNSGSRTMPLEEEEEEEEVKPVGVRLLPKYTSETP